MYTSLDPCRPTPEHHFRPVTITSASPASFTRVVNIDRSLECNHSLSHESKSLIDAATESVGACIAPLGEHLLDARSKLRTRHRPSIRSCLWGHAVQVRRQRLYGWERTIKLGVDLVDFELHGQVDGRHLETNTDVVTYLAANMRTRSAFWRLTEMLPKEEENAMG
ncbi:BQ5605_C031g10982 [Microbotryum silenes-dioicae]|uniref:BQ5605_C031g10982 protein n=1 Tax=Microbotryum silenes-dioicae TaxID=796604 RepID=A0A2X0ML66_9BASI|nr:BQ5605_C031g10982 [Microbotryum silenes-dioicae]